MNFEELVVKGRSFRRFVQEQRVPRQVLVEMVNIARRLPCSGNRQPLRYMVIHEASACARLFPCLRWAASLKGWGGPVEGERPAAYILILTDTTINKTPDCDAGIAGLALQLAATERELGACMLASIDRPKIQSEFRIPEQYQIMLVLALGAPAEKVMLEDVKPGGDVTYYRDAQSVHHVPKRSLQEVLLDY
ncbi:MAG: nitroreductase family protein [Planctomycetota bacterium]